MKCYSRDEETFYDELSDVLDMLDSDGELEPGAIVYEGDKVERTPSSYAPDGSDLMEHMATQAYEHAGEHAEGWPHDSMSAEKQKELEKLLHDWLDANLNVTFWTVTNVKRVELTAEQVQKYLGTAPGTPGVQRPATRGADAS